MITTKSRLQGNSVVVTLPSVNEKKPPTNQEYVVIYSDDGTITLIPRLADPFVDGKEAEYYEQEEWSGLFIENEEKREE